MMRIRELSQVTVAVVAISAIGTLQMFAQATQEVTVTATSLVVTAYDSSSTKPAYSTTDCSGQTSTLGSFGNIHIDCRSTETPAVTTTNTRHIRTYYAVLRGADNTYLVSCSPLFVWDRCPTYVAGQKLQFAINGSKVLLSSGSKPQKADLVESVPNSILDLPSAEEPKRFQKHDMTSVQPLDQVRVKVDCTCKNADITVDGDFVGNTPSELKLSPGKHTVLVSKAHFTTWKRELNVRPGEVNVVADISPIQ